MQRNRFLGDILSTLFDRRAADGKDNEDRDIFELCRALLSAEGEVSGLRLAQEVLCAYSGLTDTQKRAFFDFLNDELELDAADLAAKSTTYAVSPTPEGFAALSRAAEPRRQELLRRLNQPVGATADLVSMRVDLLAMLKDAPDLRRTDLDFAHLLRSWFNRGFLVLREISWDTAARILDKIVAYEAVHQINDLDDLRKRLYPPDRRCFAFFHPSMPDEPLIFVEVALTATIPNSIDDLLSEGRAPISPSDAKVATFYSISNCQKGLKGITFGNLLIKQVVAELSRDVPMLETFVTLSPIPGLNRWLRQHSTEADQGAVAQVILNGSGSGEDIVAMAARYLLGAKRDDGFPLDPVARFHLGNGAEVHAIHADADTSENGRAQSSGAMVNYLYDLPQTERRHEEFASQGVIAASKAVETSASMPLSTDLKELAS